MNVRHCLAFAVLTAVSLGPFASGCISLRARDLRDIGLQQAKCSARDESARCACWTKCVSEETDCHCSEG